MKKDVTLTVFTPAYNRAHTLTRTYESLLSQDCKDFLWLIVDDGSSDNTAELVGRWQKNENGFEIEYIYKENGGMHTAHNTAYENIHTVLNTCIDSDDKMTPGAVRKIIEKWNEVKNENLAGIVALDCDFDGNIIGKGFEDGLSKTTLNGYYARGGKGDKKLIYRTDVINSYPPYPVFENEKYVSLGYKYLLIDQDYELAVLNEPVCAVEYQPDGSSMNMFRQYLKNPKGFAFIRTVAMKYPTSKKRLFVDCVHYVSSSIIAKNKKFLAESPKKLMTFCAIPFGVALTAFVKIKTKE